jgi:hypothetical protein
MAQHALEEAQERAKEAIMAETLHATKTAEAESLVRSVPHLTKGSVMPLAPRPSGKTSLVSFSCIGLHSLEVR